MNLEGLQIFSHEVSGYKPQVDFNTCALRFSMHQICIFRTTSPILTTILKQTKSSFSFQEAVRCFLQAMMKSHTIQYATGLEKGKYTSQICTWHIAFYDARQQARSH